MALSICFTLRFTTPYLPFSASLFFFFFSSRRRHTRYWRDWSSDVCSSDLTIMRPGDLVLTPSWAFHDHGNTSDGPMVWLDGLDLPLINHMHANFFNGAFEHSQEELVAADTTTRLYAAGRLSPQWRSWSESYSPVINYPWARTGQILADAAAIGE